MKQKPNYPDMTLAFLVDELIHMNDAEEYQQALDIVYILQTRLAYTEQEIIMKLTKES